MSLSNSLLKKILKIKSENLSIKNQINFMKRDIRVKIYYQKYKKILDDFAR